MRVTLFVCARRYLIGNLRDMSAIRVNHSFIGRALDGHAFKGKSSSFAMVDRYHTTTDKGIAGSWRTI